MTLTGVMYKSMGEEEHGELTSNYTTEDNVSVPRSQPLPICLQRGVEPCEPPSLLLDSPCICPILSRPYEGYSQLLRIQEGDSNAMCRGQYSTTESNR